ncbi:MAG: radical SAM protein [bacterium]|nr:radical SAM protein [bacterium]
MRDKLKFLLIVPTVPDLRATHERPPNRKTRALRFSMLPSLYVAAAMPPYVETRIIDEDVEPVDFDTDADLIGLSFMTFCAPWAYEIADRFRKEKGKPVILGGYHATFMPEEAIQHADSICIGEAENNVPRMIEDFVAGKLKPFYKSEPIDLKGLPIPNRSLIRQSAYLVPDSLQASRGCCFRCTFCSVAAFSNYRYRIRPVDEVIEELKQLGRHVAFMDDNLIGDSSFAKELFAKMIPLKKRWATQASIGLANDDELLRLAAAAGCRMAFIGFESLSQENLKLTRKHINRGVDYRRAIEKIHRAGIAVIAAVMFGLDGDTPDVFEQTLDFAYQARIDLLTAAILTPLPGTQLFAELDAEGRIFDRDWRKYDFAHVVFQPKQMSPETLQNGLHWVQSRFYSRSSVALRIWRALRLQEPGAALAGIIPLNLSYHHRFKSTGVFEAGTGFVPPRKNSI